MQNCNAYLLTLALALILNTPAAACTRSCHRPPCGQHADTMQYYPYLAANGQYGYANKNRELVIAPSFRSAGPFTSTGFAVVEDEHGRYGVINKKGAFVLPCRHKSVRLKRVGNRTLARTEQVYSNPLRFWDWRLLPGFSLTGGSSDKRLFATDVRRANLKIIVLENNQVIDSERVAAESSYRFDSDIHPMDSCHFLLGSRLFKLTDGRIRPVARNIAGETDAGLLLQQRGSSFRLIDRGGQPASGRRYKRADSLHTTINTRPLSVRASPDQYGKAYHAQVFADEENRQYIFPDFGKPFPAQIETGAEGLWADTVLRSAMLIASIPGTDRFLFRWYNRQTERVEYPMVDTAGRWHMHPPANNRFTVVIPSGDIRWPPAGHVIPDEAIEAGWRIAAYSKITDQLYDVTIERNGRERMGLWDARTGSWRWQPEYYSIRCLDFHRGYWAFMADKKGRYGLYHLPSRQVVIPPKYHNMSADGMVSYQDEKLGYIRVYLDWRTGREYREKRN